MLQQKRSTKEQINNLIEFRQAIYENGLTDYRDAQFELVDALLANQRANSFAELSLSPLCQRTWASAYMAIEAGNQETGWIGSRLMELLPSSGVVVLPIDTTVWPHPSARTLAGLVYEHSPTAAKGKHTAVKGHVYSLLAWVPERGSSWALPLTSTVLTWERYYSKDMNKNIDPRDLKIAYIGGGSRVWARTLMADLALESDLNGRIDLYDIDFPAAKMNETLGNWIGTQPEARSTWQYTAVETLPQALRNADFVFISIQPGSFELMAHEIAVAEKYGMYFPVGDTIGVPGLMRGLRSATTFAGFAREIATHCPEAWVINYTNPMSICTRTLTKVEPQLKVFGCCHEVFGTQNILAELAQSSLDLPHKPSREQIRINVLGINHFTWIDSANYGEMDLLELLRNNLLKPGILRPYTREEIEDKKDYYYDARQIKIELFRRYGILAAAGDRHLAEFVPGFTVSPEELFRWGVIRTPLSYYDASDRHKVLVLKSPVDHKSLVYSIAPLCALQ